MTRRTPASGGESEDRTTAQSPPRAPRAYESPMRREQAARTRERILESAAQLVRESQTWEWLNLTHEAVGHRAGVAKRTVYRYFPTEADLHGAVMIFLGEQAGVDYSTVSLNSLADVTARIFASMGSFTAATSDVLRPAAVIRATGAERRAALSRAVAAEFPDRPAGEQRRLAATLDVLWNVASHVLLVESWQMSADEAVDTIVWAMDAVREAVAVRERRETSPGP